MIRVPVFAEIIDQGLRRIFQDLFRDVNAEPFVKSGFRFLEVNILKAETQLKIRHGCNFLPKDVIVSSKTGPGTYDLKYELFDAENLIISTTGAVQLRLFVGRYS